MKLVILLFSIIITVCAYLTSRIVGKKYPSPFTTPVFFSTTIIITILLLVDINYEQYKPAKEIMTFLLGPATVALAVPLYNNRGILLKNFFPASFGLVLGTVSTILSAVFILQLFGVGHLLIASISVKSVTVPIAVEVTNIIKGDPALAAAFVVMTGISGSMLGPWLMDKIKIKNSLARGLALGTIAHGQGTAQAATEGELQGAIAGVAMGIAAIVTSFIVPILFKFI
ncbi:MAG: cidB [Bacillales bacterium]|jgi:predicted murein hydrolase (TIGR00659 family)|nr:cidB [Bacillales bacterium]